MINFDVSHYTLRPNEKKEILMQADCVNQESIEEYFEILVADAEPLFFQLLGEVQKPQVYLNRDTVELGRIYAGIRELVSGDQGKHKTQSLELVNYGNLPVYFNWEDMDDPDRAVARFLKQFLRRQFNNVCKILVGMLDDYQRTCEVIDGKTLEEVVTELKLIFFTHGECTTHKQFSDLREKYSDVAHPDDQLVSDKSLPENKAAPCRSHHTTYAFQAQD